MRIELTWTPRRSWGPRLAFAGAVGRPPLRVVRLLWLGVILGVMAMPLMAANPKPLGARVLPMQSTGGSGAGHKVSLSWNASPDAAAVPGLTYQVQRANGACGASGQTFSTLSAGSAVSATSFVDQAVAPATIYAYQVVAAAPSGVVSAPTNCVTVTIPLAAASGLSGAGS